jgi:hypothetical protein
MALAHDIETLLFARFGANKLRFAFEDNGQSSLTLSWPGLDDMLPDGGLPKGVVELAAPRALGGATSVALAAVRAGQARARDAWCVWIDPEGTLYAPGVASSGVDLERMLVVRAPREKLGRVAVKVVGSGAFEVIVVDFDAISQTVQGNERPLASPKTIKRKSWSPDLLIRKLALAAESNGATVLLLTDSLRPRTVPWPVALRLELERPSRRQLAVYVAKDKRGRVGLAKVVPFAPLLTSTGRN